MPEGKWHAQNERLDWSLECGDRNGVMADEVLREWPAGVLILLSFGIGPCTSKRVVRRHYRLVVGRCNSRLAMKRSPQSVDLVRVRLVLRAHPSCLCIAEARGRLSPYQHSMNITHHSLFVIGGELRTEAGTVPCY